MNTFIKKAALLLLVAGMCVGMLADPCLSVGRDPLIAQAKERDYSRYSNTKKSWFIKRGTDHKPSEGAVKAKNLETYQAYYYDAKTKEKVLYLTFDCGYENGYTDKLLDVLKKHDVKAVFFVTKHFVKSQPKLCKRMKEEGHLVGNHTMNHPSLPTKSVSQIKNEIKGLEQIFQEETGYPLDKYFRPPMGEFSDRVLKTAQDMGYTTVFWSMAYYDYDPAKQPGKQYVIDHFKKYYHKGAIALMHNISKSNAAALDEVLKYLKKQGYRCMRIDALGQPSIVDVERPLWEENLYESGKTDLDYVKLRFIIDENGLKKPEGYEIYRKEKGGTYQLVASKKVSKDSGCRYVDRNVKAGKTYYYRVKFYCYLYGKKYVSSASESMKVKLINDQG